VRACGYPSFELDAFDTQYVMRVHRCNIGGNEVKSA
jgi:hypothetical protein